MKNMKLKLIIGLMHLSVYTMLPAVGPEGGCKTVLTSSDGVVHFTTLDAFLRSMNIPEDLKATICRQAESMADEVCWTNFPEGAQYFFIKSGLKLTASPTKMTLEQFLPAPEDVSTGLMHLSVYTMLPAVGPEGGCKTVLTSSDGVVHFTPLDAFLRSMNIPEDFEAAICCQAGSMADEVCWTNSPDGAQYFFIKSGFKLTVSPTKMVLVFPDPEDVGKK
jgi:hypothetical protein